MFLHDTHLPQLLKPECYHSQEFHELEISQLFSKGWHVVGSTNELAEEGSFFTASLLGHPIICWNKDGEVHSFVNVCAHRFSQLTSEPCGKADILRCQYHGWEYGSDGCTRKIPDAPSFKPLEKDQLRLTKLKSEVCGCLIFISLSDDGPSLRDWLGEESHDRCLDFFEGERSQNLKMDQEVDSNWKLIVENALESYHVEFVHAKTFGKSPPAEACTHVMHDNGSTFSTIEPPVKKLILALDKLVHRILGAEREELYEHTIFYPNIMIGRSKIGRWIVTSTPITPSTSQLRFYVFSCPGRRRGPFARLVFRVANRWIARQTKKVIMEDVHILPDIQRGISSPKKPSEGLISIREERVFHFQEYLAKKCGPSVTQP